jgi:hypothetical protein
MWLMSDRKPTLDYATPRSPFNWSWFLAELMPDLILVALFIAGAIAGFVMLTR